MGETATRSLAFAFVVAGARKGGGKRRGAPFARQARFRLSVRAWRDMSNCEVVALPSLEVEHPHQVQDVLRCVLHTVLFNRALGLVRPREVDLELFNITYVQCVDRNLERVIDEKVNGVLHWMERHPGKPAQVSLRFFEKRYKQAWFSKQEERLYWEQWNINVSCRQFGTIATQAGLRQRSKTTSIDTHDLQEHHEKQVRLQSLLRLVLTKILAHVNSKKEHIPPVVSSDAVPFPYEIKVSNPENSPSSLVALKKLLTQTKAPQMLT